MNGENRAEPKNALDIGRLKRTALARLLIGISAFGLMLFLPAGTFRYWQAWTYIAILFIPASLVTFCFMRKNPELLERRMRTGEKEAKQRKIVQLGSGLFAIAFLFPGLDRRWGWSSVPPAVVLAANVLIVLGYALVVLSMRENRFAARTVEVERRQKVVTTGPYSVVRHPMYSGMLLMYGLSPLALGSYWALIPFGLMLLVLPVRLVHEEKFLLLELEGYREYCQKTKYRLIPGVW